MINLSPIHINIFTKLLLCPCVTTKMNGKPPDEDYPPCHP